MKKIMITTVLLLMMLSMTVSAGTYSCRSYSQNRCCAAGCNGRKYNNSYYCSGINVSSTTARTSVDQMECTARHITISIITQ